MDADVAASGVNVVLEDLLLSGIENVAGGHKEDDDVVAGEVFGCEDGRIFGAIGLDVVFECQSFEGGGGGWDGVVAISGGFGEDKDALLGAGWLVHRYSVG